MLKSIVENIVNRTLLTEITCKDAYQRFYKDIPFETYENMIEFIGGLATNNPQVIAESILNEALTLNEMSAKDDMTVLVARTYLKT